MEIIGISACLVGKNTKYDGKNNKNDKILEYLKDKQVILFCPEVTGGLLTPRSPSEINGNKVINKDGVDVTSFFKDGAIKEINKLKEQNVKTIIVKEKSPSCGYRKIYDGSFSSTLISGSGIFTRLAIENGFKILTEEDFKK